jgi:hypothetical protein
MQAIKTTCKLGGKDLDCYTVIGRDKCFPKIKEGKVILFLYHYFDIETLLADNELKDYSNSYKGEGKLPSIEVTLIHNTKFNAYDYVDSVIEELGGEKEELGD